MRRCFWFSLVVVGAWACGGSENPAADDDGAGGQQPSVTASGSGAGGASASTGAGAAGGYAQGGASAAATCPAALPPGWLFCDDFEQPDVGARYFEYGDDEGDFVRSSEQAASGNYAMQVVFQAGEVGAGGMKLRIGNNPIGNDIAPGQDFEEIFWRMRVMHQVGWTGSPAKLSRATIMAKSDWSQAMIAHLWSAGDVLLGDPAACVQNGAVACQGYNDFAQFDWLGQMPGTRPIFATSDAGQWRCVEGRVKLNTPGQSDGAFEFWIDGQLESSRTDLDWRGSWTAYGINAVFFENYWNEGSPVEQKRWFDDIVIATVPIGCD